jgi:cell wall-associated NlpC family hydrolase
MPGGAPAPSGASDPGVTTRGAEAAAAAATALDFRGVPYRLGGADPGGFDCSGLVQYVFALQGISVPRTVDDLRRTGASVSPADVRPGDLLFFATNGRGVSHVGIAIGDGQFVHAPSEGGTVRIDRLETPYWSAQFVEARRVEGTW